MLIQINATSRRQAPNRDLADIDVGHAVHDLQPDLADLASELALIAARTDDTAAARRLIEMADEVRALALQEAADSPIYDSATIFMHSVRANNIADLYADEHIANPTQRN